MKRKILLVITIMCGMAILTYCAFGARSDSDETQKPTSAPTQNASEKASESIDEDQGEWDTEDMPTGDHTQSREEEPTQTPSEETASAEEISTEETTAKTDGSSETYEGSKVETGKDENEGEWDVS